MAPDPMLAALRPYCASLVAMGRWRIARQVSLVLAGAAVEGIGIVLLMPVLLLAFGNGAPSGRLAALTQHLAEQTGRATALAIIVAAFSLLAALRGVIVYSRDSGLLAFSGELVDRWRFRLVDALALASWTRLRALNRGTVEFAVTSDVARLAQGSDRLLRGGTALLQLLVLVGFACALAPLPAIGALLAFLVMLPLARHSLRAAWDQGSLITAQGGRRHQAFAEFIAALKLAKAHEAQARYANDFFAISIALRHAGLVYNRAQTRNAQLFQALTAITAAWLLLAGTIGLHMAPALLSALVVLLARLPGPALALAQGAQALSAMLPAVAHLLALEEQLREDEPASPVGPVFLPDTCAPASIRLSGVRFCHAPDQPDVLRGIDLTIGSGTFVALLGASGCGKTTLGDILIGLTAPLEGTLTVDGVPINSAGQRVAWRRRIGYVPQDPFLFDRPIRDNLTWDTPDVGDTAVWHALDQAEAGEFVRGLPFGLETRVGDRGTLLSGGERQRLCLARALLRRPRLLLLDEATNALDIASEARLLQTLARLRGTTTIVMITHRLPVGLQLDRVLRLNEGRIEEQVA